MEMDQPDKPRPESSMSTGVSRMLVLLSLNAALGGFLFGYDTSSISASMLQVKQSRSNPGCPGLADERLSSLQQEMVTSFVVLGAFLSATMAGTLNGRFGRRAVLLGGAFVFLIGAVLMATATNLRYMLIARIIAGLGVGVASHTMPLYVSECAPASARGSLCFLNDLMIVVGQFTAAIVSMAFFYGKVANGWRWILGIAAVPSSLMFMGLLSMPESPRWLIMEGRPDEARKALQTLWRKTEDDQAAIDQEFDLIVEGVRAQSAGGEGGVATPWWLIWKDLHMSRALVLGCGLQVLQQWSGINTIMYYGATILTRAEPPRDSLDCFASSTLQAVAYSCFFPASQLVGVISSWALVDRVGRRPLILTSLIGVVISLVLTGIAFSMRKVNEATVVVSVLLYLVSFGLGMSPVPWTVNAEIYPLRFRAQCLSISTSTNWLMNFIVSQTFLTLSLSLSTYQGDERSHPNGVFWLYGAISAVGLIVLWRMMPETKGVPLEEMDNLFVNAEERTLAR